MTLHEVANQFSAGKASAHQILHHELSIRKVSAKWVPKHRWPKGIQGDHSKRTFGRFNHDENKFLNCIVTRDEMKVHYAESETKPQSNQWKRACSQPSKNFKLSPSAGKVTLVAFRYSRRIIQLPKGRTVTAWYCSEVRPRLAPGMIMIPLILPYLQPNINFFIPSSVQHRILPAPPPPLRLYLFPADKKVSLEKKIWEQGFSYLFFLKISAVNKYLSISRSDLLHGL